MKRPAFRVDLGESDVDPFVENVLDDGQRQSDAHDGTVLSAVALTVRVAMYPNREAGMAELLRATDEATHGVIGMRRSHSMDACPPL